MSDLASSPGASTRSEDNRLQFPPRLITSNFPPTDQEVLHVRSNLLPAIQRNKDKVNAKIGTLRETMQRLKAAQKALNGQYERCESLVSTRRTVPCEIWAHIFSFFRESPDKFRRWERNAFSPHRTLWSISQVCQVWRNIAFSIPSLWSCIDLSFPTDGQKEVDVHMLERILLFSRQHPLHIILHNELQTDCDYGPTYQNLMLQKIFAESYRWRSLELTDDWADSDVLFPAGALHGRLPLLETLHLHLWQGLADGSMRRLAAEDQPVIWVFNDCPRLSKVTLTGERRVLSLPCTQITELHIEDASDNIWLDDDCISYVRWLRQFPSLEALHMMPFDYDDEEEVESEVITINSLRKLDTACVRLLNHLTVPHLEEVILRKDHPRESETAFEAFCGLIDRSDCLQSITSLTIDDIAVSSEAHVLHTLLLCARNLTHLALRFTMSLTRPSLDAIRCPPNVLLMAEVTRIIQSLELPGEQENDTHPQPIFLPRLSSLSLELLHHADPRYVPYFGCEGVFPRIMQSRWRGNQALGVAQLKSCKIELTAAHLEQAVLRDATSGVKTWDVLNRYTGEVASLEALIDDGMKLSVSITSALVKQHQSNTIVEIPMAHRRR